MQPFELSAEHLAAVERRRRIVVRYDITGDPKEFVGEPPPPEQLAKWWDAQLSLQDMPGTQIDSIIWWSEGGVEASFKSDVRPVGEWIKGWVEAGVEIPSLALEQSQRRGIESFYQLAMNGYDVGWDGTKVVPATIPEKAAHPEWLLWPHGHVESGYMNYAVPGVRDYVTEIVREVAWRFDHDGINLDFARLDVLMPQGQQWELREHLNDLMRTLRAVLLERERLRGRPYLLSVQIPPDVVSCHATGIDIETWVREGLVDILILGCRTFDVDVRDFRRLTAGHPVKLYPCIDAHHSSDGYFHPTLEVQRGAAANWLHQGADGVCTFNYPDRTPESARRAGTYNELMETDYWGGCMRAQRELGTPETLRRTDKVFFAERRGGGHFMIPPPEDWSTPRAMSLNTNMLAPLPALLPNIPTGTPQPKEDWPGPPKQSSDYRDGKVDTFVRVWVGDDVNAEARPCGRSPCARCCPTRTAQSATGSIRCCWRRSTAISTTARRAWTWWGASSCGSTTSCCRRRPWRTAGWSSRPSRRSWRKGRTWSGCGSTRQRRTASGSRWRSWRSTSGIASGATSRAPRSLGHRDGCRRLRRGVRSLLPWCGRR